MRPELLTLLLFLTAALALNVTPGPDMLYVLARGAQQGRKAGIISALGIATGCVIQTIIVALGLASLLLAVPLLFTIIKTAGAIYLLYLGIRMLFSRKALLTHTEVQQAGLWRIYSQAVLTNVLNPKVALFFVAFLPQFVNPAWGYIPLQLLLLGTLFNCSGTIVNVLVGILAGTLGKWFKQHERATK